MQPEILHTGTSSDVHLFWWAYWFYLGSFLLFTLFGATRAPRFGRLAHLALAAGFVLHTVGLVWRWRLAGHVPMANMYEYASLLAWMAALSYLFIELRYRKTIVGTFVAPVVVAVMTCASLLPKDITQQLVPALQSYWLAIHVSLAALGEGAFAVAFAVSLMYLVQQARSGGAAFATAAAAPGGAPPLRAASRLQAQVGGGAPQLGMVAGMVAVLDAEDPLPLGSFEPNGGGDATPRGQAEVLPTLGLLDEINYRAVAIGYPLFTVGALFAGAIWAYKAWGTFWSWDPKEVGALIVWLFYTAYLHARLQRAWRGRRAAWLSVAGFAIVILSFLGNLWLGGNHAYN